ncbi:MAG: hypothetical protein ACLP29_17245 [Dissulfurispiraceae bacterium]|jgi:hypothetical protein
MSGKRTFSLLAVLHELNDREFRRTLDLFPADLRYYVILAGSIVGAEISKRVQETPAAVVRSGGAFVSDMLSISAPREDQVFKGVLEASLVEMLKYELRFSCMNCRNFNHCVDLDNLSVGELFERRVNGDERQELKDEISAQACRALCRTRYLDIDDAHKRCKDFVHQYSTSSLGEVFGRYSDIAAALQREYGIDHRTVLQRMVAVNMDFCEKIKEQSLYY